LNKINKMEKLTAEQIIEKLKIIFDDVSPFAFEESPNNFENFPEALEAQKVRNEFKNKFCNGYKWLDGKYEEYCQLPSEFDIIEKLWKEKIKLDWKEVDQYGGEGKGDTWWSIKYFPDHDVYLRVYGYYQSYNGTEFYDGWGCVSEVKPQQKTITVYE